MQTDPSIGIASSGPVFPVAFNNASDPCQLGPDLVVPACLQSDFQQMVVVRRCQLPVVEAGLFGSLYLFGVNVTLILFGIPGDKMIQGTRLGLGALLHDGMVDLFDLLFPEQSCHPA